MEGCTEACSSIAGAVCGFWVKVTEDLANLLAEKTIVAETRAGQRPGQGRAGQRLGQGSTPEA
ncbi:hypothetical protein MMC14_010806, partial [Varicellaria rhodocarpa]|nr:hypothetical protein [Varicellaria rhodocarpa]